MAKIIVVTGPPAGGKSTYVRESAAPGEIVVDFDLLAVTFGSSSAYDAGKDVKAVTFAARKAAVDVILRGVDTKAWIIHTQPTDAQLADYEKVGADVVTIDPGMDVALEQAAADDRPAWTEGKIVQWYEQAAKADLLSRGNFFG